MKGVVGAMQCPVESCLRSVYRRCRGIHVCGRDCRGVACRARGRSVSVRVVVVNGRCILGWIQVAMGGGPMTIMESAAAAGGMTEAKKVATELAVVVVCLSDHGAGGDFGDTDGGKAERAVAVVVAVDDAIALDLTPT